DKYQHLVDEMDRTRRVDRVYRRLRADGGRHNRSGAATPSRPPSTEMTLHGRVLNDIALDAEALGRKIAALATALEHGSEPVLGRDVRPTIEKIWSLILAVDDLVHAADRRGACLI